MQVQCQHCQAGYTLPADRLVPGRRVQFACRHCGTKVIAAVPALAESPASSPGVAAAPPVADPPAPATSAARQASQPPAPAEDTRWFVAGPDGSYRKLAASEVTAAIQAGTVLPSTLIWRKGQAEWLPMADVPTWSAAVAAAASVSVDPRGAVAASSEAGQPAAVSTVAPAAQPSVHAARPSAVPVPARRTTSVGLGSGGTDPRQAARSAGVDEGDTGAHAAADERAASQPDAGGADAVRSVAGLASADAHQAAVSLPVVRPKRVEGPAPARPRLPDRRAPLAPDRPGNGSRLGGGDARPAQAAPALALRHSPRAPGPAPSQDIAPVADHAVESGPHAPSSDTYVGPKPAFTRRIGSAAEREALVAEADGRLRLERGLRRWQLIAMCTSIIAIGSLALAALLGWQLRAATSAPACPPTVAHGSGAP